MWRGDFTYWRTIALGALTAGLLVAALGLGAQAEANTTYRTAFLSRYPASGFTTEAFNVGRSACNVCHTSFTPTFVFTAYGTDFGSHPLHASNPTAAMQALETLVSVVKVGSGTVSSSVAGSSIQPITCGGDCSEPYPPVPNVAVLTLTATPGIGSTFGGWSGAGCSGTGSCQIASFSEDRTVTATFTAAPVTLTVTPAGTGSGTVASSPAGISCPADCSQAYPPGTQITLTATEAPGSTFGGWSGGGCSGTDPCVLDIAAATTVTATFTLIDSPPGPIRTLSRSGQDALAPQVAIDADGNAIFVWQRFDGAHWRIQTRVRFPGGLGMIQTISPPGQDARSPQLAVDASGNAVFAWQRFDGVNWRIQTRDGAAGTDDLSLTGVQNLSVAGQDARAPRLAIDATGRVVFAWERFDGTHWRIQTCARAVSGGACAIRDLSDAGRDAHSPDVAVTAGGKAVVAWRAFDGANWRIEARVRLAGGGLGAVHRVSPAGQDAKSAQAAVRGTGTAVFAWQRFDGSHWRIQTRDGVAGTDLTLDAVQTLSGAGQDARAPRVALDATGSAIFAWERFDGSNWRIQVRARSVGGVDLSPVRTLSSANRDAQSPELAFDSTGTPVFTWQRFDGTDWRVQARAGSVETGDFTSVQTFSGAGRDARAPHLAADASGNAVFTWRRFDGTHWRVQTRRWPTP